MGNKSVPNYADYASNIVYSINLPGSSTPGRMFVGQRKDPFVVNLGEVFDLVNLDPVGAPNAKPDLLADANVTSLVLELPIAFLTAAGSPIIGGWTTASMRQARVLNPTPNADANKPPSVEGGAFVQQSRLANPLVNEVVIGLKDKDRFNASEPKDDAQFLKVRHAPHAASTPRDAVRGAGADVVSAHRPRPGVPDRRAWVDRGIPGGREIMRLNTSIAPVSKGSQNRLGVLGGDNAGYPNGRRPGDDVVDMSFRVVMGVLLASAQAPAGQLPFTDGAFVDDSAFDATFPYLKTPLRGSPNPVGPGSTVTAK